MDSAAIHFFDAGIMENAAIRGIMRVIIPFDPAILFQGRMSVRGRRGIRRAASEAFGVADRFRQARMPRIAAQSGFPGGQGD